LLPFHSADDLAMLIDSFSSVESDDRVYGENEEIEDPWDCPIYEQGRWIPLLQLMSATNPPTEHGKIAGFTFLSIINRTRLLYDSRRIPHD
jgi:hypothetical protein